MRKILVDNENVLAELDNGILIGIWKASFVDLLVAEKIVNERVRTLEGKKHPTLIKIKSLKTITKEARDFLGSPKGYEGVVAFAIQVDSPVKNMIASMFLFLNPPLVPTKIFKDEDKAKEWLKQYVTQ
jgi:hypothetical protein